MAVFKTNLISRGILISTLCLASGVVGATSLTEVAPMDGWASVNIQTTGGSKADQNHIFTVSSYQDFLAALKAAKKSDSIIKVAGQIDLSNGVPFTDHDDQKKRSQMKIPSNVTLVGISPSAGFVNGSLIVKNVQNVIIRNLTVETPVDVAPHFEDGDGWNAEWDGISLDNAQHVWVDHVTVTDGKFTDAQYTKKDGWEYVQHDGALDIKHGSDFVTVSYSLFKNHDKTMLIGHSDKNGEQDTNKLHVTLHDNVFESVVQRTPRIRFGEVHSYNNLFIGDADKSLTYRFMYAFGLGFHGSIISQNNVFNIQNMKSPCEVLKSWDASATFSDQNSIVNNSPFDTKSCYSGEKPTWTVPYHFALKTAQQVEQLKSEAGSAHLSFN